MSFELVDSGWESVLEDAISTTSSEIRIVCPFIKHDSIRRFLRRPAPSVTRVITRFYLRDFCEGVSDIAALEILLKKGANIRGVSNLHAKLYLFGNRRVILTSANLTEAALRRNHEFGFVSEEPRIVQRCSQYFDDLWNRAGSDLEENRLWNWKERITSVRLRGSRPSEADQLPDEGVILDVGLPPIGAPPLVTEARQSFVKFFGTSKNRADLSMTIREEVMRSGCHWACTYPNRQRPRQVEDGAVIFMGRLTSNMDTIIYGRAIALKHIEGRDDASAIDLSRRPWKKNWPHYIRVHDAEFLSGSLSNGVSLDELIIEHNKDAFMSTQRNAARGKGNVNPRLAFRRKPSVSLTSQSAEWLNRRLDAAFQKYGKMSPAELDGLDWPEVTGS